ncbi:MAG: hypothetical protein Q7T18_11385, partial [Sedimentisphaerales bacterium]|nr:hypothetical protein [Sedimentisphaerales bacterium]
LRLFATFLVGAQLGLGAMNAAHVILWFVDSALVFLLWSVAAEIDLEKARRHYFGKSKRR